MSTSDTSTEHDTSEPGKGAARHGAVRRLRALAHGRNAAWVAAAVLMALGGTIASFVGAQGMAQSNSDKAKLAFHLNSAEVAATLKLAIQHEEDLVVNASAFIAGQPEREPCRIRPLGRIGEGDAALPGAARHRVRRAASRPAPARLRKEDGRSTRCGRWARTPRSRCRAMH